MKVKKVSDIMTSVVVTARPEMRLTEVIKLMLRHNVGAIPVVDSQQDMVGIVSRRDILREMDRLYSQY